MCERVAMPGGGFAIICGGRNHHKFDKRRCAYPGCMARVSVECDHKADGSAKTCDRATCRAHAKPIGQDVDWCWLCAREELKRGNSPRLGL
jgi:hypothetical protein